MLEPIIEALQKIDLELEHNIRCINNKLAEIHFVLEDIQAALDTAEAEKLPNPFAPDDETFGKEL